MIETLLQDENKLLKIQKRENYQIYTGVIEIFRLGQDLMWSLRLY